MEHEISKIVEIISTTSPFLFGVALKQVQVQIIRKIFYIVVVSLLISGYCYVANKYKSNIVNNDGYYDIVAPFVIFGGMTCIFMFVSCVFSFAEIVERIINPEYYAVEILLNLIP
jgi:peptidoglycan/LPS O-acetylase OafA/YrhL